MTKSKFFMRFMPSQPKVVRHPLVESKFTFEVDLGYGFSEYIVPLFFNSEKDAETWYDKMTTEIEELLKKAEENHGHNSERM